MEKRNFVRVDLPECASIKHDAQMFFANVKNVSLQGLFLTTTQQIPAQTPLQITVYVSPNSSIHLNADVVRCDDDGIGVRIKRMDVNSFVHLRNAITARCNDYELVMRETYKITNCIQ